jgi:hypothetical protein
MLILVFTGIPPGSDTTSRMRGDGGERLSMRVTRDSV